MPRGAASEVACARLSEVSFCGPVSCAQQRPPLPAVPLRAFRAAINASRWPAQRPLRWAVEGDRERNNFFKCDALKTLTLVDTVYTMEP